MIGDSRLAFDSKALNGRRRVPAANFEKKLIEILDAMGLSAMTHRIRRILGGHSRLKCRSVGQFGILCTSKLRRVQSLASKESKPLPVPPDGLMAERS